MYHLKQTHKGRSLFILVTQQAHDRLLISAVTRHRTAFTVLRAPAPGGARSPFPASVQVRVQPLVLALVLPGQASSFSGLRRESLQPRDLHPPPREATENLRSPAGGGELGAGHPAVHTSGGCVSSARSSGCDQPRTRFRFCSETFSLLSAAARGLFIASDKAVFAERLMSSQPLTPLHFIMETLMNQERF